MILNGGIFVDLICNNINKAFDESKGFLESNIIPIMINKKSYYVFPHYKGKNRATEFGEPVQL